ncbi:MAG: hypothetical protein D8M59_01535 [Planctomycetes bacterium]|nr:hypothetical protein [Planctomycetota bacterium]NOG54596.1 cyclodeaminase/cyclohydrolase family protein [Planctomycetota bacterium]
MTISEMPITDFLHQLAEKKPTPGGGASSAITGAVAAATAAMALAYSVRPKSNPPDTAAAIDAARGVLASLAQQLAAAADEDAAAYARLNELQKLPADDRRRSAEMGEAVLEATTVPLNAARHACQILRICDEMAELCNKWLISDLAIGADLAEAAVRACAWNVRINLPQITDEPTRAGLAAELDQQCNDAADLHGRLHAACAAAIMPG